MTARGMRDKPLIVNGPANPMPNARKFLLDCYTRKRRPILIHQHGSFYTWHKTRWHETDKSTIRAQLYEAFEAARYPRPVDGGGNELVPFAPNRSKIANLMEALEAVTTQLDPITAPGWFPDADLGRQLPACEMISCGNGLLHVPLADCGRTCPSSSTPHPCRLTTTRTRQPRNGG